MKNEATIKMYSFTIDCVDPQELANFYVKLLNWDLVYTDETYACVGAPGTVQGAYPGLTFQKNLYYTPPVWPEEPQAQQQMAHLDFAVDDVEKAVKHAISCGATMAKDQFSEGWRVMFDPAGHPFCLSDMKSLMNSEGFSLL